MEVLPGQGESTVARKQRAAPNLRWYFGFFVVSGLCGLVYEIVWLRLAMASFGVTTALASIVISMFMAGLGLGSWGAGILARKVLAAHAQRALRFYSLAELCIGASSLAVPFELKLGRQLLLHIGSLGAWQSWSYYLLAGILLAFTLLPWCTSMGSTFPLLMVAIRQTAFPGESERSFSYLYLANVLGALIGTLSTAWILIELLGFQGTLLVAGALNLALAVCAYAMSRNLDSTGLPSKPIAGKASARRLYSLPSNASLAFLFTTGLVSMGMEVVWIREFTPYLGPFVYAFASILVVYLAATFMGSRRYRLEAQSLPSGGSAKAWSFLALFAILPVVSADPLLPLQGLQAAGLRLIVIALFCAVAGYLTPLLVDAWSSGNPARAGNAYAVNILGSIIGPLIAGFWLLPWLGERKAVLALSLPLFGIAAFTAFRRQAESEPQTARKARVTFAFSAIAAIVLFTVSHDYESKYAIKEVRRDYAATVIATGRGFDRQLFVNGVNMTVLSPDNKFMVHLPFAFLGRAPRNGLIICFGMGTGFRSMLSWGIPTTAVDLIPSVPKLFGYFHEDAPRLLGSPLARVVTDDGRRFLDGSTEKYDVIVIDPPPPPQAPGTSLLYSGEFYDVIKKHLQSDGILQEWFFIDRNDLAIRASTTRSLMQSFPYVRAFQYNSDGQGIYFLASMKPIPATSAAALASRLPSTAAADFVEWGPAKTAADQFSLALSHEMNLNQFIAQSPRTPAITDDAPINEYFLLRKWFHYYK